MAWNEAVVTGKGLELLGESLSGGSIVITEAVGGGACSDAVSLMGLTKVTEPCYCLKTAKVSRVGSELTVNVRLQNVGMEEGFVLKQIGLFARLDKGDEQGDSVLFAVIQDHSGEEIPSQTENPEFLLEFDFVIPVSNAGKIDAVISPEIFATLEELGDACDSFDREIDGIDGRLGGLEKGFNELDNSLSEHKNDEVRHITSAERTAWNGKAPGNHTHPAASASAAGLMSAADKSKLDGVAAGANAYTHPTTSGNKHIPSGGSSGQILRWSADGTAAWGADNNTTYSNMTAATASAAGKAGLVPAPAAGAQAKYLRGDGTWQTPPDTNTTYSAATASAAGLMSAADKTKLDGIATGANNYTYTLPAASSTVRGGVKIGYTANGKNYPVQLSNEQMYVNVPWTDNNTTYSNMTAATASAAGKAGLVPAPAAGAQAKYLRGDGTWQTPPDTNTTYSAATASTAGLMSAADKTKLDGIATGANNYTYTLPAASSTVRGGVKIGYTANGKNYPVQLSNEQMYVNVPWTDTNTTYSNMTAATSSAAGKAGLVPAPAAGAQAKYLRGDGTWQTPPDTNTTYSAATTSAAGLMSAADKTKLNNTLSIKAIVEGVTSSLTVSAGYSSIPYNTGSTKALVEIWKHSTVTNSSGLSVSATSYGSHYFTGLSANMTAIGAVTFYNGASGTVSVAVNADGSLKLGGSDFNSSNVKYRVTWFI